MTSSDPIVLGQYTAGPPVTLSWVSAGAAEQVVLGQYTAGSPVTLCWVTAGPAQQVVLTPDGYRVWVDDGAPSIVPGAEVGDLYLDSSDGNLYRLD